MNTGAADKKRDAARLTAAACVAVVALNAAGDAFPRDVVVGGGVSVGYEYDDRQYEDDEEDSAGPEEEQTGTGQQDAADTETDNEDNRDERYSRLRLTPLVTLSSSSPKDELNLRYAPSFWYDFEDSDNNVDHDFLATFGRYLTRNWQASLSDRFRYSDVVENRYGDSRRRDESGDDTTATDTATDTTVDSSTDAAPDGRTRLTDTDNRRRYWTNDLALRSQYAYREDSRFLVGYNYGILENTETDDGGDYEDYDRHEALSEIGHRFNPVWKFSVFGSYVRGLIDEVDSDSSVVVVDGEETVVDNDDDLKEYRATTVLQADFFDHHTHALEYSFYGVDFDSAVNDDVTIQDVTLGWRWNYSKNGFFGLGAGPTYTKTEDADGEWGYNGKMSLSYSFERAYFDLSAKHGYEVLSFTGTDDNGLREFWESLLRIGYQFQDNLSANAYAGYRYEDEEIITEISSAAAEETTTEEPGDTATESESAAVESVVVTEREEVNRKRFSTGVSLGYSFWQLYQLSLSYDYSKQDSEAVDDSFDEHRVALTLSYETELLKW